jgi:hypothetical protein
MEASKITPNIDIPVLLDHARDGALAGRESAHVNEAHTAIWNRLRAERRDVAREPRFTRPPRPRVASR